MVTVDVKNKVGLSLLEESLVGYSRAEVIAIAARGIEFGAEVLRYYEGTDNEFELSSLIEELLVESGLL